MTMKEMENRSGMTRANIRFYEAEGLLAPARSENRYRDYSEEDLEVLKKIRLLRCLQLSLEEIKALQSGRRELPEALDRQLVKLGHEKKELERSQEVCRVMRDEGVRYQNLDAQRYLGILEQGALPLPPVQDAVPEVRVPWRRYFARNMDILFYSIVWNVFLALVLGVNIAMRSEGGKILDSIVPLLWMLLTEPVQLALFGTTFGKWLLGLRVTDNEGKRLSFEGARARTWQMFLRGMGLGIPIWNLVRLWKSYKACEEGETNEWEYGSAVSLKDERGWRTAAYIGAGICMGVASAAAYRMSAMPPNRGEITVAEFSENYNRLSKFYGFGSGGSLDREGKWVQDRSWEGWYTVVVGGHENPVYQFSETDGMMTGMSFSIVSQGDGNWISDYREEMILSILAFAGAQEGNSIFSGEMRRAADAVRNAGFESFEFSVLGVRVTCEAAYSGYVPVPDSGMLIYKEGEECWYSISFSMVKEGNSSAIRHREVKIASLRDFARLASAKMS